MSSPEEAMPDAETLGRLERAEETYAAYSDAMGGLDHHGRVLPEWQLLPPSGRQAWAAAVQAARKGGSGG